MSQGFCLFLFQEYHGREGWGIQQQITKIQVQVTICAWPKRPEGDTVDASQTMQTRAKAQEWAEAMEKGENWKSKPAKTGGTNNADVMRNESFDGNHILGRQAYLPERPFLWSCNAGYRRGGDGDGGSKPRVS